MLKHCDNDLGAVLLDSAPPPDLMKVGVFRAAISKFERKARRMYFTCMFH